jgi:hypothetical protein
MNCFSPTPTRKAFVFRLAAGLFALFGLSYLVMSTAALVNAADAIRMDSRQQVDVPGSTITVSEQAKRLAGIETTPLKAAARQETIQAYGTVLSLEKLFRSQERYVKDRAEMEATRAQLRYARENYDRLRLLYEKGQNTSQKDVQEAEAAWRSDQASFEAAQGVFHSGRAAIRQEWGPVLAGWLEQFTSSFRQLMKQEILLVRVTLSPQASIPSAPVSAILETPAGRQVVSSLLSPAPQTDQRIQGMAFFYTVGGNLGLLPGMNVSASLPVGKEAEGVMLPASAILWWQGAPWVYVQTGPDRFRRRLVHNYLLFPTGWFVPQGFKPGERVVTAGAQLLLSRELEPLIQGGD